MPMVSRKLRDLRHRFFYGLLLNRKHELRQFGDPHGFCQWKICPTGLNRQSIVYSGGVGDDVSFEKDLVKNFGCSAVLFDPSPIGIKTMALPENKLPELHFFPVALAAHKGKLRLGAPRPGDRSWFAKDDDPTALEVPCIDLKSLMEQNGHMHIDLLKLDIEGSEYEVLGDLLDKRIAVRQICVEYHNGILPGITRKQTVFSMFRILACGFKLIDQSGSNHTFIKP